MTIDPKILEQLKSLGIDPSKPTWVSTQPMDAANLPSVKAQREMLAKLRDVLKNQLEIDLIKLDQAQEELARLKNGGGS